jgi:hypothetical protein
MAALTVSGSAATGDSMLLTELTELTELAGLGQLAGLG